MMEKSDRFAFRKELNSLKSNLETLHTGRGVAYLATNVFDPIGLITLFTIRAKLLLQSLRSQGLGWDEVMPEEPSRKWVHELSELEQLHIPRCHTYWPLSQTAKVECMHLKMNQNLPKPVLFSSEFPLKRAKPLRALQYLKQEMLLLRRSPYLVCS